MSLPTPPQHAALSDFSKAFGLHVVDASGKTPVRIEADLNVTAGVLGLILSQRDIFRQNREIVFSDHEGERAVMTPRAFRSWINNQVLIFEKRDKDTDVPIPGILTTDAAATIMEAQTFLKSIRPIAGINSVRLPVIRDNGELELLPEGYDAQTRIFTTDRGPSFPLDMDLDSAKGNMTRLLTSFPLTDARSVAVQVAAMLALFIRHLPDGSSLRPGFLWLANKSESGKSVLAKAAQYPVLGRAPAVKMKKGEQLDKEMEAFVIAAAPSLFLDNVYGGIESATIDQMLTSEESEGRAMGGHGLFRAKNSAVLFVTGNRLELNQDAERRFLVVDLFEKGDPCERGIARSNILDDKAMKNPAWRSQMLACLWAFVRNWHDKSMPEGTIARGSFEAYSFLLGGIVEAAGYVSPFQRAEIPDSINPEKQEFIELLEALLCDMGDKKTADYTMEDLARLARASGIMERQVGTQQDGVRLTAKYEKQNASSMFCVDIGLLTEAHRSAFGKRIKKMAGGEHVVKGQRLEFGKRYQARKSVFTIRLTD